MRASGYGYQWWLGTFKLDGRDVASYSARGRGGQFILVLPDQQMVVVFTSPPDHPLTLQLLDIIAVTFSPQRAIEGGALSDLRFAVHSGTWYR